MDHAYTMSGSQDLSSNTQTNSTVVDEEENVDDIEEVPENDDDNVYQEDDSLDDCHEDRTDHTFASLGDDAASDQPTQVFSVLIPTEEWMQMLPPQYLLHYIRERTVFRDSGKASREGRESTAPLKRGWLQGAWRETLKEAIGKQTGIPCVINFNSSNFLKQPFSRKVGPPLWRVRACCRQDDGLCLKFNLKVQDFHPSKPQVEIIVSAHGTLLEGPEGEERHTITASDHMKAIKSLQRYSATSSQNNPNGFGNADAAVDDSMLDADDTEVQRLKLTVPTSDWISFLPAEAAEAYVLERSHLAKDRLALEGQEAWAKGLRHFVPRVTKECRQYLKRALAERTGLPCRIGLTGRCHLKPPFSRKKRAPLFVTNGFCGRKDLKCLRFRFTVQDFDPQTPFVTVSVEIRGRLLAGPEGDERHSRRPTDDPVAFPVHQRGAKRTASGAPEARGKRLRRNSKKGGPAADVDVADVAGDATDAYAVQALQTEAWPEEFDLNSAEVILDDGKVRDEYATREDAVNTIQVMSDVNGAESALGEDAARELVQLANEALSLAGTTADGSGQTQLTATKIVQSGDQVFIFVSDPNEPQTGEGATIEAVEVNCDELAADHVVDHVADQHAVDGDHSHGEMVQAVDENGSLVEYLLPNTVALPEPELEPEPDADVPCMEYRWQLQLPMTDWLKLLPPKSLRYYIHERTVGREVWVEEGWERQFRSQTLQNGWRDLVRRAAVEQTDIPCQVCFRGRSSLKLPFSRKHAAALWRTQGYCARGDRTCLVYKFCVQDFHPDDENVTVQVYAVGKLHRDCRRWFTGQGTLVDMDSVTRDWPQCDGDLEAEEQELEAEGRKGSLLRVKEEPMEAASEEWDDDGHMLDGPTLDQSQDEDDEEEEEEVSTTHEPLQAATKAEAMTPRAVAEPAVAEPAGEDQLYQAVMKSLVTLKSSLAAARRCPLKMQAALRLVRNADAVVAAPCKTADCLCRPQQPARAPSKPRLRWQDKVRQGVRPDAQHDELLVEAPSLPESRTPAQPLNPSPSLGLCATPRSAAATAPAAVTPSPARTPARTAPGSPVRTPESLWQKVTRAGPVVLTAVKQQPSIIRLSPAQIAANARRGVTPSPAADAPQPSVLTPRSSSKLVSLSSAIVRSAVLTPSIIKANAAVSQNPETTPRSPKPPVSQSVVSSSQDAEAGVEAQPGRGQQQDGGADPSWIVDEMRSVILGGERAEQKQGAGVKLTAVKPTVRLVPKSDVPAVVKAAVKSALAASGKASEPAVETAAKTPAKAAEKVGEKVAGKVPVVVAKASPASSATPVTEASPARGVSTRIMVKKVGQNVTADDLPLVERALRSLEAPKNAAPTEESEPQAPQAAQQRPASKTVFAPSRPVTRGVTKMVVSSASPTDPPPLVPIGKGPAPSKPQTTGTPGGRGSRVALAVSNKPAETPTLTAAATPSPQPARVPTRAAVQAKLVSPVKAIFPKEGKVLILKPSASHILRSSPRRPL